jgi:thioredoxin
MLSLRLDRRCLLLAMAVVAIAANAATGFADDVNAPLWLSKAKAKVPSLQNESQFNQALEQAGDRLLVVDFYADWCFPCKLLEETFKELSQEYHQSASFFRIDVDKNRSLAMKYGARGIPYVAFIKNKTVVHSLLGVHPKDTYARAIRRFSQTTTGQSRIEGPDGILVDGIRVIHRSPVSGLDHIYVYRGESVRLVVSNLTFPYSVHIPEYNISQSGNVGEDLEVYFKAKDVGVFPVFCNGNCPTGDGSQYGQIVVLQYEAPDNASFKELTATQVKELIDSTAPFILDVRTPNEYYYAHIPQAKLIPVQQLGKRTGEIAAYKTKPIVVYCHSGNRSTVAAEILIQHGFTQLYHLRRGIIEWIKYDYPLVRQQDSGRG